MQTISLPKCMWYLVRQIHETTYDVRELTVYAVDEFHAENEVNKNGWHSTKVNLACKCGTMTAEHDYDCDNSHLDT